MKTLVLSLFMVLGLNLTSFCEEETSLADATVSSEQSEEGNTSFSPSPLGPNGGLLIRLGEEKPFVEAVLDHESGKIFIFFMTAAQDDYLYLEATEVKAKLTEIRDRKSNELPLPADLSLKAAADQWNEGQFDKSQFLFEHADLKDCAGFKLTLLNVKLAEDFSLEKIEIDFDLQKLRELMQQ